jgi:hypothetical protein
MSSEDVIYTYTRKSAVNNTSLNPTFLLRDIAHPLYDMCNIWMWKVQSEHDVSFHIGHKPDDTGSTGYITSYLVVLETWLCVSTDGIFWNLPTLGKNVGSTISCSFLQSKFKTNSQVVQENHEQWSCLFYSQHWKVILNFTQACCRDFGFVI